MNLKKAVLSTAATILFGLTGCSVGSDKSLNFSDNHIAVTPLPADFYLAPIDDQGNADLGYQGSAKIDHFVLKGDTYYGEGSEVDGLQIQLAKLNTINNAYVAQLSVKTSDPIYELVRIYQNIITVLEPGTADDAAMALRGNQDIFTISSTKSIIFTNDNQVIAGFKTFDNIPQGFNTIVFRLATPDQLSWLQDLVAKANQPKSPAPPTPTPTPARDVADFLMFDQGGYSNTVLMDQFYNYGLDGMDVDRVSEYVQTFIEKLKERQDCLSTISDASYAIVYARTANYTGLGGLIKLREQEQADPNDVNNPTSGWQEGEYIYKYAFQGNTDSDVFFERYGCSSPIADIIFGNMQKWILSTVQ
jgi:hypothetical protein